MIIDFLNYIRVFDFLVSENGHMHFPIIVQSLTTIVVQSIAVCICRTLQRINYSLVRVLRVHNLIRVLIEV